MKKIYCIIAFFLILLAMLYISQKEDSGTGKNPDTAATPAETAVHKIGVPVYNLTDGEVRMFREYLENYIAGCFTDVTFLYSETITNEEELQSFLSTCVEEGVEGVMAFISYDLKKEVEFCAENKIYYIRAAGTHHSAEFESVANNTWYLGEIGPGADIEKKAGAEVAGNMIKEDRKRFLLFSGGASAGNEMHRLRTAAMLETIEELKGVKFDTQPEELALVKEPAEINAGDITVTIFPGYISREANAAAAKEMIAKGNFDAVLSVVSLSPVMRDIKKAKITGGTVDCFSQDNWLAFQAGTLSCVVGKYESEIGPAFAALYNAITGHASLYRENGRAFRLEQGFWSAPDLNTYNKMYGLSSGIVINAYSYEDLYSEIKVLNPDATFETFKALVKAYTFEECLKRRGAEK